MQSVIPQVVVDFVIKYVEAHSGPAGPQGATGVVGAAEFIRTDQLPNNSVPPGTAFTIDTEVFNTTAAGLLLLLP